MPIYNYVCKECGENFDLLIGITSEKVKLKCADALNIAKIFGVKPLEIGRICNQKKIRMSQCQLGCFK